jgi:hypothetical protein
MDNLKIPHGWRAAESKKPTKSTERWARYKDSPYEVSTRGRVRRRQENGAFSYRKPRSDDRKHHRVNLTWDGKREEPLVHQLVMELHGPPRPKGEQIVILHKNNNGEDNRLSNLKWGTRSQNVKQAHDDGLMD